MTSERFLPVDRLSGTLIGRAWVPAHLTGTVAGPSPVWLREDGVHDLSKVAPTMADLLNGDLALHTVLPDQLRRLGEVETVIRNTMRAQRETAVPHFLAPVDLQSIKACGVTFANSLLERVIEERAGGDAARAEAVRQNIQAQLGDDIANVRPGSEAADTLKTMLQAEGLWSQYLEVGIGPYAEVFTKAQPMSAVGPGAEVGILSISSWNNPEPEVVLLVNARGEVTGVTLGNDVNLRDIEGRSALLLGKAKDNNASCAIGPFIRLFDDGFTLDDVRQMAVTLTIEGEDGFSLSEVSLMNQISRDVLELVDHTIGPNHQYPDGFALFTGTLFAPTQDRDDAGQGFTHKPGDIVRIGAKELGVLQNRVVTCDQAPPWEFGLSALMRNLSQRRLL